MSDRFHTITARGARLVLDLEVGHVRSLDFEVARRTIAPFHMAPWVDEPAIVGDPAIPGGLKYLSGDFFCAPFCASDIEEAPGHGWPANTRWTFAGEDRGTDRVTARFVLERPVLGARLTKEVTLRDGHPFAYQRHVFTGGRGAVPVASHAMTRFAGRGRLAFSKKAFGDLPDRQQENDPERGRSLFAKDVRFEDLARLPLADGFVVDIRDYPVADGHEDFAMLVEAPGSPLGWAAAVRPDAGDVMLSLKNPADFPVTFLWYSNGGRFYAPWNGRHCGVLGIEEGRAWSMHGHAASIAPNPLSDLGIPTALVLDPGGEAAVSHVVGGIPLPEGWRDIADIAISGETLRIAGDAGQAVAYPFDPSFLATAGR